MPAKKESTTALHMSDTKRLHFTMMRHLVALIFVLLACAGARANDWFVSDSAGLANAIANSAGGDTITLSTTGSFTGSFTLNAKTSLVTIRSSAYASLPPAGVRIDPARDGANLAVVNCSVYTNERCFDINGSNWKLYGLDMRNVAGVTTNRLIAVGSDSATSLSAVPDDIIFDHVYVHALNAGVTRGLGLNATNAVVRDSWFEGFRNNGQECQAILLGNGLNAVIDNNFLSAVGEVVMSNGAGAVVMFGNLTFTHNYCLVPQKYNPWNHAGFDTVDVAEAAQLPCSVSSAGTTLTCVGHGLTGDYILRVVKLTSGPQAGQQRTIVDVPNGNTITVDQPFTVDQSGVNATIYRPFVHKNTFELKTLTGTNNIIEGNVFDGSWSYGQNGHGDVVSVRSDGGRIDGAIIKNVSYRYNLHRNFLQSWLSMLTHDTDPAGKSLRNVAFTDNLVFPLESPTGGLPGRIRADAIIVAQGSGVGSDGLNISHNTLDGTSTPVNQTALGFDSTTFYPRHQNLVVKNNILLFGTDGVREFNSGTTGTAALQNATLVNAGQLGTYAFNNNAFLYAPSTSIIGYPASTWFEPSRTALNFVNPANVDYSIAPGTTYAAGGARAADDGKALGADIATLATKLGASSTAFGTASIKAVTGAWPSVQFGAAGYSAGEGDGHVTLTITRTGDTSSPSSVEYRTQDTDTFTVGCSDASSNQGGAYGRCDFTTTAGMVTFAAGETQKTITVPLVDDAHVENSETFQMTLLNPTNAALGAIPTATVTILDNDAAGEANPIYNSTFFVRQQYLDFLAREPDAGGLNAWVSVLNNCSDVNNDPSCDRIHVSQSFFGSAEFQLKGLYVFHFYKVAFNRLPSYAEFLPDMSFVAGSTTDEVYARKAQLAFNFTQRQEFLNAYADLSNTDYVNTLLGRYSLTQVTTIDPVNPDGSTKVTLTSGDLVSRLGSGTLTRAQVLRAIADSDEVGTAEYNKAFIAMQYYGYLRRTPEDAGYQNWLAYFNAHPDDSRGVTNGFMNSLEYKLRFGQ